MQNNFNEILQSIEAKTPLIQISIIESQGSTPRTAGTKMLVKKDCSIIGTIGGGLYEAKAIEFSKKILEIQDNIKIKDYILYFNMQEKLIATDMDMICGGELRLLIEYISPSDDNILIYKTLIENQQENKSLTLITKIDISKKIQKNLTYTKQVVKIDNALYSFDKMKKSINLEKIPQEILKRLQNNLEKNPSLENKNILLDNYEYCFYTLLKPHTLHIFGAGHVSCELAKISHYLNFKSFIIDDRKEFVNSERFPNAFVTVLENLHVTTIMNYFTRYNLGKSDAIIIVTRGHTNDRDVLMASLHEKVGYLGMIGSHSKRKSIYNYLLKNGYSEEELATVHSPIGLDIGAQSPQEIAISIAAQLIQWRAGKILL